MTDMKIISILLGTLNASSVTQGSKVSAGTSALASVATTTFTGGVILTNASTTAAETMTQGRLMSSSVAAHVYDG